VNNSRKCAHCLRGFKNKQAVRSHLRWCAAWLAVRGHDREAKTKRPEEKIESTTGWQCCNDACTYVVAGACPGHCPACNEITWTEIELKGDGAARDHLKLSARVRALEEKLVRRVEALEKQLQDVSTAFGDLLESQRRELMKRR